jgi:hypothetical protein
METSIIDYFKITLSRIKLDKKTFLKEYKIALDWLSKEDIEELKYWLRYSPGGPNNSAGFLT